MVIFLIIVGLALAGFLTLGFVKNAQDAKAKRKQEEEAAERQRAHKELVDKAEAGDKEAQEQLIKEGVNIYDDFNYQQYDVYKFDAESIVRLCSIINKWMDVMKFPNFELGDITENVINDDRIMGNAMYNSKGKTERGDTLSITYHFGKYTVNDLSYSIHLKALPESAKKLEAWIKSGYEASINAIPKSARPDLADDE